MRQSGPPTVKTAERIFESDYKGRGKPAFHIFSQYLPQKKNRHLSSSLGKRVQHSTADEIVAGEAYTLLYINIYTYISVICMLIYLYYNLIYIYIYIYMHIYIYLLKKTYVLVLLNEQIVRALADRDTYIRTEQLIALFYSMGLSCRRDSSVNRCEFGLP